MKKLDTKDQEMSPEFTSADQTEPAIYYDRRQLLWARKQHIAASLQ